ncbi:hypothetical protein Tco_0357312 [Tanacetum coccineum]
METKDTSSLCLDFKELDLKELQKKASLSKEGSMNGFRALHLTFKLLSLKDISAWSADGFEDTALKELKTMFTKVFKSELINPSNFNSSRYRKHFEIYIGFEAHLFKYTMIGNMDFIKKYMIETILHEQEIQKQLNEKKMQPQEFKRPANNSVKESITKSNQKICIAIKYKLQKKRRWNGIFKITSFTPSGSFKRRLKGTRIEHGFKHAFLSLFGQEIETFTALDDGLVVIESSGTESRKQDTSSRSGNDTNVDDADIIPVYDKEPMVEALEVSRYAVLNAVDMAYWWNSLEYTPRSSLISFTVISLTVDQAWIRRTFFAGYGVLSQN